MIDNPSHTTFYTNIKPLKPKLTPQIKQIQADMLVNKEHIKDVLHKDKSVTPHYKLSFNKQFWVDAKKPISVVLDEAHELFSARRSMSKVNEILSNFTAMVRRILGETDQEGDLIYITQLDRRIDVIAREMAHQIRYHVCYYTKFCRRCGLSWFEDTDMPERAKTCLKCGDWRLDRKNFNVRVRFVGNIRSYDAWRDFGIKTWYKDKVYSNLEKYFIFYDTLQWEGLFTELYE